MILRNMFLLFKVLCATKYSVDEDIDGNSVYHILKLIEFSRKKQIYGWLVYNLYEFSQEVIKEISKN
jgi:hypothetical protein